MIHDRKEIVITIVNKFNVFPSGLVSLLQSLSEDMWLEVPLAKIKNHPTPTTFYPNPIAMSLDVFNTKSKILNL